MWNCDWSSDVCYYDLSKELFEKSFNEIRDNFNAMFRKLFGGWKSNIFLEEGPDILEAGIEIFAQPPGKELRSISLLSGGEKSMTAVALLLAIFQAKPSPFCILDEVDAALDESNIGRFSQVLEEFSQKSQFVVITHNKRTMTVGGTLFGITMEEPGISKKVAVKLEEMAESDRPRRTPDVKGLPQEPPIKEEPLPVEPAPGHPQESPDVEEALQDPPTANVTPAQAGVKEEPLPLAVTSG